MNDTRRRPGRLRRVLIWIGASVGAVLLLAVAGIVIYSQAGRMDAEPAPLAAVEHSPDVTLVDRGDAWTLSPTGTNTGSGLVFIPGAKVDPLAYADMLAGIAMNGTEVVIVKPPLGLAILDLRPPSTFTALAPEVTTWSVGGHSLGGVKACQWASDGEFDALVLFAAYCAVDLSRSPVGVLSLSGSEDLLTTPEKIEGARHLLPEHTLFHEIEGASHASFGAYGAQPGDGTATISRLDTYAQIDQLVLWFLP